MSETHLEAPVSQETAQVSQQGLKLGGLGALTVTWVRDPLPPQKDTLLPCPPGPQPGHGVGQEEGRCILVTTSCDYWGQGPTQCLLH